MSCIFVLIFDFSIDPSQSFSNLNKYATAFASTPPQLYVYMEIDREPTGGSRLSRRPGRTGTTFAVIVIAIVIAIVIRTDVVANCRKSRFESLRSSYVLISTV